MYLETDRGLRAASGDRRRRRVRHAQRLREQLRHRSDQDDGAGEYRARRHQHHVLHDGMFKATRDVSAGTREIYNAIQKEFRLNPELTSKAIKGEMSDTIDQDMLKATIVSATDELISGIELAFSYFRSQTKIETIDWIVLSGGGALVPYLPEYLQSKLNIPLEIANPLRNVDYDPELFQYLQPEKIAPLLTVSVGLAMRKVR